MDNGPKGDIYIKYFADQLANAHAHIWDLKTMPPLIVDRINIELKI